jgi:hypothetical protein
MIPSEVHRKAYEDFDLVVSLDDEGDAEIEILFHDATTRLPMHWDDLRDIIDFAAIHALGMTSPYVVEYEDTREGMKA